MTTDQSDIVERLRKIADASRREDGTDIPLGEDLREAAAEITRLREALAAVKEQEERWWTGVTSSSEAMMGIAAAIRARGR